MELQVSPLELRQYMTFLHLCHTCSHQDSSNLVPGNTVTADKKETNNEQSLELQHQTNLLDEWVFHKFLSRVVSSGKGFFLKYLGAGITPHVSIGPHKLWYSK